MDTLQLLVQALQTGDEAQIALLPPDLRELAEDRRRQADELRVVSTALQNSHFAGILLGRPDSGAMERALTERFQIYLFDWEYCLAAFRPERFGDSFLQGADENDGAAMDKALDLLTHISNQLIRPRHHVHTHRVESDVIAVIRMDGDTLEQVKALVAQILDRAADQRDIHFSAAVSGQHHGIGQLAAAYSETTRTFSHRDQEEEKPRVLLYRDILDRTDPAAEDENYPEREALLSALVAEGNLDRAEEALEALLEGCLHSSPAAAAQIQCRLLGLADRLILAAESWSSPPFPRLRDFPLEPLLRSRSVRETAGQLRELFAHLRLIAREAGPPSDEANRVLRYIDSHIHDYNLSLTGVSDALGIPSGRVSVSLKRATGMGVLDYIHTSRLKTAKEYILYSDRTVREIAEHLGYGSSLALNRIFRRYEGFSPNEFRRRYRQNGNPG